MGKLPIVCGGERVGEADAERERLYTCLNVRAPLRRGVWRAWAVGDAGEVLIGALEPVNGQGAISRRFSRQALSQAGELSRVELRPANATETRPGIAARDTETRPGTAARDMETRRGTAARDTEARPGTAARNAQAAARATEIPEAWRRPGQGQRLFRSARFQRQLRGVRDALTRTDGERRRVALLRDEDAPFPLPELFCLASAARIGAKDYWVFSFDRQGWPVL